MSETEDKKPAKEANTEKSEASTTGNHCCKPHTSLYVSVIALLLGLYAAIIVSTDTGSGNIENRLTNLEAQLTDMDGHITSLDKEVQSNRENMIQTKLRKALQNVQEIGSLAGEETKDTISEVEKMLQALTAISEQLEPSEQTESPIETTAEPKTITAEPIQPEAVIDKPVTEDTSGDDLSADETIDDTKIEQSIQNEADLPAEPITDTAPDSSDPDSSDQEVGSEAEPEQTTPDTH